MTSYLHSFPVCCFCIKRFFPVLSFFLTLVPASLQANQLDDITDLGLEELLNLEVFTASRKKESIYNSTSAVYVIGQQQIRRSGLQSIPELLRLAPGVQVSHISDNTWSISIRGFGGQFENKLLVMVDGRSVYTPFFSGVYWDVQDLLLEDIERIEVIRGPGGTLWEI